MGKLTLTQRVETLEQGLRLLAESNVSLTEKVVELRDESQQPLKVEDPPSTNLSQEEWFRLVNHFGLMVDLRRDSPHLDFKSAETWFKLKLMTEALILIEPELHRWRVPLVRFVQGPNKELGLLEAKNLTDSAIAEVKRGFEFEKEVSNQQ